MFVIDRCSYNLIKAFIYSIDCVTFLKFFRLSLKINMKSSLSVLKVDEARSLFNDLKISFTTGAGTLVLSWTKPHKKFIQWMLYLSSFFFLPPKDMKPIQSLVFGMFPLFISMFFISNTNFILIFVWGISLQAIKIESKISYSTLFIYSDRHSHTALDFSLLWEKELISIFDRVSEVIEGDKNARNFGHLLTISSWYCDPNIMSSMFESYNICRLSWFRFSSFLSFLNSLNLIIAASFFSKTGHF